MRTKTMLALLALLVAAGLAAVGHVRGGPDAPAAEGWLTDFETAKKAAAQRDAPILVNFSGSDWCGWCIRLDKEVFATEAFKEFARDNLVLFVADFPRGTPQTEALAGQNEALAREYGIRGFPTVLLLDRQGKELARTGYRRGGPESYVEHLKELMANAAKADA